MQNILILSSNLNWGQQSGLVAILENLGFTVDLQGSQQAVQIGPATGAVFIHGAKPAQIEFDDVARPCQCFGITPSSAEFEADHVLSEPIVERNVIELLTRYDIPPLRSDEIAVMESGLLELCGNDSTFVAELARISIEANREDLRALENALSDANGVVAAECAHRIKGSMRLIQCRSMMVLCDRLEKACRDGEPPGLRHAIFGLLAVGVRLLEAGLQALREAEQSPP